MQKTLSLVICLMLTVPLANFGFGDAQAEGMLIELRQRYADLSKQADVVLGEPLYAPEPPKAAISCADGDTLSTDGMNLADYLKAFGAPEAPLCEDMLAAQKEMQLLGEHPGYTKEAALAQRLGRKALLLISQYGKDLTRLSAVAAAALQAVNDIQLLGSDDSGIADALMNALSAAYEAAVEEMFRKLTEEHDYSLIRPMIDAVRASQLLSGNSNINTDEFLHRLQDALQFEMRIVYRIDLPFDHWEETATLKLAPVSLENLLSLSGSGTGSMTSYSNDNVPEAYCRAPNFQAEAELSDFLPCQGTVKLTLSPFYPPAATLVLPDEEDPITVETPLMRTCWELAQAQNLQEGWYVFPLPLMNLNALAVDTALQFNPSGTLNTEFDITLTHKPGK